MDTQTLQPESTTPQLRRKRARTSLRAADSGPLRASFGLACRAPDRAAGDAGTDRAPVARPPAIRATGGAIPEPVAAISTTDARKGDRPAVFFDPFFVFPSPISHVPARESAFPDRKTRKPSRKRTAQGRKRRKASRKSANLPGKTLFLGWKPQKPPGKTPNPSRKPVFPPGKSQNLPGFHRFQPRFRHFLPMKTQIPSTFSGPQTGHATARTCPSKHPDGYREAVK